VSLLTTTTTAAYEYRTGSELPLYALKRRKAQKQCGFRAKSTYGHCIKDKVLIDPACGTGGFLIGALNKMIKDEGLPYCESIDIVKNNIFGIEVEPTTASLCVTNMILRGDGKSGIIKDNCFINEQYPNQEVDFVLMNPPFPNKKTDIPSTDFIDRGLKSLSKRGILASIIPYSLLVNIGEWHKSILKENTILHIITLPQELFNPYASYNTAIIFIEKGIPHNNKKVFFSKIVNDGFKIKKKDRISTTGSQLDLIKNAYFDKKEIPEVTAFRVINEECIAHRPPQEAGIIN
jgi:type I restriction enzyme M protein